MIQREVSHMKLFNPKLEFSNTLFLTLIQCDFSSCHWRKRICKILSVEGYDISFPDLYFPRLMVLNFKMYINTVPHYYDFSDQRVILVINSVDIKMTIKKHIHFGHNMFD